MAARLTSTRWIAITRSWPSSHLKIDRTAWRGCGRTPRSRLDRTAIAARSSHDLGDYVVESPPLEQTMIVEASMPQSTPDQRPIVARSWHDRGKKCGRIMVVLEAKLKLNHRGIQATSHAYGIAPSTPRNHLHDRLQ